MDYSFNLPTENLIRFRIDLIKSVSTDDIQKEILDYFNITSCILSKEVSSNVEKPHVHVVGYLPSSHTMADVRKRIGRVLFKNKSQSVGGHATVANKWDSMTKHKDFINVMTLCNINYAQFHVYYICKDKNIIVNTLNPFLNLDGYEQILDKLPETVKNIQSKHKHRQKNPNYLKILMQKFKKEHFDQISPLGYQEKMRKILLFVIKSFQTQNQSEDEHLAKSVENFVLIKFTQSIYNTYFLKDNSPQFDEIFCKCLG